MKSPLYMLKETEASRKLERYFQDVEDVLFIIGGDGTYLRALSDFEHGQLPKTICAFNEGTCGALLPLNPDNIDTLSLQIKEGRLRTIARHRLFISSHNKSVANEIIIRPRNHGLGKFVIYTDKGTIKVNGDGITISTKSGSTGHNFSLGGPILMLDSIVINCSAANRCHFRPIVLPIQSKIKVRVEKGIGILDNYTFMYDDCFEIECGDTFNVYVEDTYSPFDIVSQLFFNKHS